LAPELSKDIRRGQLTRPALVISGSASFGSGLNSFIKGDRMKSSIRDRAEGMGRQAKGKAKEIVGHARKNPDMEAEGMGEQIAGTAQRKIGQTKKVFGH
jgi:uncharacterized protein YjbJ (UPF0337 family)